jgi:uncharacterized membrane protein (Fun14 family)
MSWVVSSVPAQGPGMRHRGMGPGMMMGDSAMMGGMRGCGMMLGLMTPRAVIPIDDNTIIVVVGNRLLKYDKNLKLREEATIEVDYEQMRNLMKRAWESCPMQSDTVTPSRKE